MWGRGAGSGPKGGGRGERCLWMITAHFAAPTAGQKAVIHNSKRALEPADSAGSGGFEHTCMLGLIRL